MINNQNFNFMKTIEEFNVGKKHNEICKNVLDNLPSGKITKTIFKEVFAKLYCKGDPNELIYLDMIIQLNKNRIYLYKHPFTYSTIVNNMEINNYIVEIDKVSNMLFLKKKPKTILAALYDIQKRVLLDDKINKDDQIMAYTLADLFIHSFIFWTDIMKTNKSLKPLSFIKKMAEMVLYDWVFYKECAIASLYADNPVDPRWVRRECIINSAYASLAYFLFGEKTTPIWVN